MPVSPLPHASRSQNATIQVLDATGSPSSPNTAVAMIVLYAVTGCVALLFCIIIISGAIKAIRHPERYGPRRNRDGADGWSQSRAGGLTRAILETFPIVKFGTSTQETQETETNETKMPLPDAMTRQIPPAQPGLSPAEAGTSKSPSNPPENITRPTTPPTTGGEPITEASASPGNAVGSLERLPPGIGRETCPICIMNFEEGDDLRVLPCDGAHRFHQSCVDPWLLEISTACPLCRHDFIALENMISGGPVTEEAQDPESNHRTSRLRRFSRYLRFARHGRDQDTGDATRPLTGVTRSPITESDTRLLHRDSQV